MIAIMVWGIIVAFAVGMVTGIYRERRRFARSYRAKILARHEQIQKKHDLFMAKIDRRMDRW